MSVATKTARSPHDGELARMSHREILTAMSGLLLGMFVAILSSTVVTNALPTIINRLHGSETGYTWVVVATLLAMTATTPIWGKLADLVSPKLLVQLALLVYVTGSAVAGVSQSLGMLVGARVLQGVGAGGLTALVQVVMALMIAPRERGRYSGYLGAVFALATVLGPLVGGIIVDTPWLGWRWCFYVGVPFAIAALIVLQRTLHLPRSARHIKIDYLGGTLIVVAVSLLLVWVSLAGQSFAWLSLTTLVMVLGAVTVFALAIYVESSVAEPIIPLRLFRKPTMVLASVASLFIGSALFGVTVFLSQYFQVSRNESPTMSGILTIPMVLGMFFSSLIVGRIITRTGKWKRYLVTGVVVLPVGLAVLSTMRADTNYWVLALGMVLAGVGMGATMQNLVLAVQNSVRVQDMGSASATVTFIRSLGGAIGVSVLGAVLSNRVTARVDAGLTALGVHGSNGGSVGVPDPAAMPGPVAHLVETAYGTGTSWVFAISAIAAVLGTIAVLFIREVPLRRSNLHDDADESAPADVAALSDRASEPPALALAGRRLVPVGAGD